MGSMANFRYFEALLALDDPWEAIDLYWIAEKGPEEIKLATPKAYFGNKTVRTLSKRQFGVLAPYPFALDARSHGYPDIGWVMRVRDIAAIEVQRDKHLPIEALVTKISSRIEDKERAQYVEWALRVWVKNGVFKASTVVAKGRSYTRLTFAVRQARREKERLFSASLGAELTELSDRIGLIVGHGPTVGTYRENLLQSVLRRHLPERYHVATGFIFGLSRKIDILIYDSVDHAPLFREGNLVVVPKEAVRAIIEVKTTLTSIGLRESLTMFKQSSELDGHQPFFRGVYAFRSSMSKARLLDEIQSFYKPAYNKPIDLNGVYEPFSHFGCICVHGRDFLFSTYRKDADDRFMPYLYTKESVLGLKSQASHFMQLLLRHLGVEGNPLTSDRYLMQMLGEDTLVEEKFALVENNSWGAYFDADEDAVEDADAVVLHAEERITQYQHRIHAFDAAPARAKKSPSIAPLASGQSTEDQP